MKHVFAFAIVPFCRFGLLFKDEVKAKKGNAKDTLIKTQFKQNFNEEFASTNTYTVAFWGSATRLLSANRPDYKME